MGIISSGQIPFSGTKTPNVIDVIMKDILSVHEIFFFTKCIVFSWVKIETTQNSLALSFHDLKEGILLGRSSNTGTSIQKLILQFVEKYELKRF